MKLKVPAIRPQQLGVPDVLELTELARPVPANATFVKWTAKKGAVVPLTHHVNEQVTWITEGLAEVHSQGRKYIMRAGDIMIIPPNVPHVFNFLDDTIDIDVFVPGRQDWINGTATYLSQGLSADAGRAT